MLAYFETTPDIQSALAREKQIKGWTRDKKITLIEQQNPMWQDLSIGWF
jgi:putative endonuclease